MVDGVQLVSGQNTEPPHYSKTPTTEVARASAFWSADPKSNENYMQTVISCGDPHGTSQKKKTVLDLGL